jgi:hypothetical protein
VDDTITNVSKLIKSVWEAKQLGLMGKSPIHKCPDKCPHERFGVELKEGILELAKPLSLIYEKGLLESGENPDATYLRSYAWKIAPQIMGTRLLNRESLDRQEQSINNLVNILDISRDEAAQLITSDPLKTTASSKIIKEMASDIEPWFNIIGKKETTILFNKSNSVATRVYTLPKSSEKIINKSYNEWN